MYLVSGSLTIAEPAISSTDSGVRRHALGLRAPLRYALAAIIDSTAGSMSCSCR